MNGLSLVGLLLAVTIGMWVFYAHPSGGVSPVQRHAQNTQAVENAREVCLLSAKSAYLTELSIADINCPSENGVPATTCVQQSPAGAPIYAKFQSATAKCSS